MLTLTSPVDTPFHRMAAGTKLAVLAVFTVALFWIRSPGLMALAAGAVAGLYLLGGRGFARHGMQMLRPLWPFVAIVAVWHLWQGAFTEGCVILLRMGAAVAAANLVTMTTRLSAMIEVVERLARPLGGVLPPRRLAMAIGLVIRFIPVLAERGAQLGLAYRARSARSGGWRLVAPAALAALDDAENVANALRARGGTG